MIVIFRTIPYLRTGFTVGCPGTNSDVSETVFKDVNSKLIESHKV